MSDVVASARTARERLAQGLSALQGPGVPEHLMNVAEPIARAMSSLHRVEATNGQTVLESGPIALEAVRTALGMLQSHSVSHPSVEAALEAVAGSLGLVHRLVKITSAPPPAQAQPVAPARAVPAHAPARIQPNVAPATPYVATAQALGPAGFGATSPLAHGPTAVAAKPATIQEPRLAPQPQRIAANAAAVTKPSSGSFQSATPNLAGADSAFAPNSTLQSQGAERPPPGASTPAFRVDDTQPEAKPMAAPLPSQLRLETALGAHSPTNFYKGLSGNDVVDAGGLFIATYQIPKIGTPLLLKISLPGGYEFDAQAVVRWTREPSSASDGASPGFGPQFTAISTEGRQLVYRYVRNREPLFHDDL